MSRLARLLAGLLALAALAAPAAQAQPAAPAALQARLDAIADGYDMGVAVADLGDGWMAAHDAKRPFPQQSVAKLWTAIAVLDAVDAGRLSLDGTIPVARSDLSVFTEPLARRVGPGGYEASVGELLSLAIVESDNAANDVLVRRLGGRAALQAVMASKGISGVAAGIEQRELQSRIAGLDWRPEYAGSRRFEAARAALPWPERQAALEAYLAAPEDGAAPAAVARALGRLWSGRLLSPNSTALLLRLMAESVHGRDRLAGGLPAGWRIAHKTGTGQRLGELQVGTNDVGVLTAPDGHAYAVAVFIARSRRPLAAREALMRRVARAVVAAWEEAGAGAGEQDGGPAKPR